MDVPIGGHQPSITLHKFRPLPSLFSREMIVKAIDVCPKDRREVCIDRSRIASWQSTDGRRQMGREGDLGESNTPRNLGNLLFVL